MDVKLTVLSGVEPQKPRKEEFLEEEKNENRYDKMTSLETKKDKRP